MARNNPKPPITANNVFRLHVHGQCYGQATINRFDFTSSEGTLSISDCLNSFWTYNRDEWLACVTADWTLTRIVGELLNNVAMDTVVFTDTVNDTGLHAGAADTAFVAASFYRGTTLRGQHGHGGFRLAGVPLTVITANGYTAGYKALLEALAQTLVNPLPSVANPGQSWVPCLTVLEAINPTTFSRDVRAAQITTYIPDARLSTQRSRRPRREV